MWFIEGTLNNTTFSKLIRSRTKPDPKDPTKQIDDPFVIGRREGDLIFSSDRRVSRIHAHIHLIPNNNHNNHSKPKLYLTDLSKFGTKINNKALTKNQRHELFENDTICVGLTTSIATIKWVPFLALFSKIPVEQRKSMKIIIQNMGGMISNSNANEWNNNVTHLFVPRGSVNITQKVISAIIHEKYIITNDWLKYVLKNNEFPSESDTDKYIPSNLIEWLQKGHANEIKYGIKRQDLFSGKLFIFLDKKLLSTHRNIIQQCNGKCILYNVNEIRDKIESEIFDMDNVNAFCIFDDGNASIDGYKCFNSCCIANAICCCDVKGSEQELEWNCAVKKEEKKENEEGTSDVLDLLMMDCDENDVNDVNVGVKQENKKRKRDMSMSVGEDDEDDIFASPPVKRHKASSNDVVLSAIQVAKTQSISPQKEELDVDIERNKMSGRKLNCSQFTSIKRLKQQRQLQSNSCVYTSAIYRNLSIMVNRDKDKNKEIKKDQNKNKNKRGQKKKKKSKLAFKDLSGRRNLRNEYADEDKYYDEDKILEKQKELYSNDNILGIQKEFIEMELVMNDNDNNNDNDNSNDGRNESQLNNNKLPKKAFQQPNFKAFKGNPNYLASIESRLKNMVEFDYDFNNKNNEENEFDDKEFRKQRQREEKQEKEIHNLFESKKKTKKATPKKRTRKKTKTKKKEVVGVGRGRKRKRKEIEKEDSDSDDIDDDDMEILDNNHNKKKRKKLALTKTTKSRRKRYGR